ncbi:MAG TPA: Uma2 family endonuclease [Pyrinomonadaceae bacterium]|nr:Uma2 family endonuclease [Pyrinomonadaceae bacterium]
MSRNLTQPEAYIPPELIGVSKRVTPKQFERLCRKYRDLRLELTSTGELMVMPPTGSQTGRRNSNLTYQLGAWARKDGTGICFGSSAGFALPNGAVRAPDASWIRREKWERLTTREREGFAPICPDFVVELRSETDRISQLFSKMEEYIANGAALGWLIDPLARQVYVYRPGRDPLILESPETVSGDPLLPGFNLELAALW